MKTTNRSNFKMLSDPKMPKIHLILYPSARNCTAHKGEFGTSIFEKEDTQTHLKAEDENCKKKSVQR